MLVNRIMIMVKIMKQIKKYSTVGYVMIGDREQYKAYWRLQRSDLLD